MRKFLAALLGTIIISANAYASVVLEAASTEYLNLGSAICTSYPVTISAWMLVNDVTNDYDPFWLGLSSIQNQQFARLESSGATSGSDAYTAIVRDATLQKNTGAGSVTPSTWVHIGGVFTSTTSRCVYPNGGTKGCSVDTVSPSTPDETEIGRRGGSFPTGYLDGKVAQVAVWCGARSDGEMANLAAGDNPLTIGTPDAYWPLNSDATDHSGNGNDLTTNGAGITFDTGDNPSVDAEPSTGSNAMLMIIRMLMR